MPEAVFAGGTLLGFDFGLKRIGVAVGQTATNTANALVTVRHFDAPDWDAIGKLVREWKPAACVVGLPLDLSGNESDMSALARKFGAELTERFGCMVFYADERLTSRAADTHFVEARSQGHARRKDVRRLDAIAAKIILENWLQSAAAGGEAFSSVPQD